MTNEEKNARFLGLYCMILADGVIDARELETLYKIGTESYGLTPEQITNSVKYAGTSFIFPEKMEDKVRFLYEMAQIAWADEVLEDSEIKLIKSYAIRMGFDKRNTDEIVKYLLDKAKYNVAYADVLHEILTSK